MSTGSKIHWTNSTWNPLAGCSKVSPGCQNCYAATMAYRLQAMGVKGYEGLAQKHPNGRIDWTGKVNLIPTALDLPLKWRKPRMIFVDSMSDLFHPDVPDDFIVQVFGIIASCQQHTFQILTKRPERMRDFLSAFQRFRVSEFPHVWLGISCENQETADERIPLLLQTPAALRWISAEPLLGPIDLTKVLLNDGDALGNNLFAHGEGVGLDWIVCGGESGPNARPMHPDWAQSLRDQCAAAHVPYFFKQWGEWVQSDDARLFSKSIKENFFDGEQFYRVGKRANGNLLDGRPHQEYPNPR